MKKLFVLLFSSIFVFSILFANGATHAKDIKPPTTLTIYKVSNKTTAVGGKTEAKATVEVKLGSKLLGKATADSKGKYKVRIKAQKAGTKLTVVARDKAGNAKKVTVTVLVGWNNEMGDQQLVTEKVEASNFILEVTAPTVIKNGQILKVKGTLKYVGDETIKLLHGGPIIRFSFTGSNKNRYFIDLGYTTQLKTGQIIEVEDEFKVSEVGKNSLIARTTVLEVDGELIAGIGNEEYIKSDMSERIIELEKSRITLKPIMIEVREK